MKQKKRPKDKIVVPEPKNDSEEADRELFLQAFEKPTQIYRYLRTRNIVLPIFLHRTLTYMKQRRSVSNVKRKTFKVDSLLHEAENKQSRTQTHSYKSQFMNLTFTGLFMDEDVHKESLEAEAILLKVCHKKRKDASSTLTQTSLGKVKVPVNPGTADPLHNSPPETISIAQDHFVHNGGHAVKSYVLLLRVTCPLSPVISNGLCNGDISDSSQSDEPATKKRRNGMTNVSGDKVVYGSELVIYDRLKRCQMTSGDYELVLYDQEAKKHIKNPGSWETIMHGKAVGAFEVFNTCPTLRLTVSWTDVAQDIQDNSGILSAHHEFLNNNQYSNHIMANFDSGTKLSPKDANPSTPKKHTRLFYQFLYKTNTRQQTEAREDLHCPWCSLNCLEMYSLLKHLRLCHARFNFIYVPHSKGAVIDVSINDRYDGSYAGNPHDLHSHIGYAFTRNGPVRRTPVTNVIVYRPKRPEHSILEFMDHESENPVNRQLVQGHNRLYYHSGIYIPITPHEINTDNEDENDPLWLRQKTVQMIDEFTDVNEGEKELMKMWNLHVMKNAYIADCQIVEACQTFVQEFGRRIVEENLGTNFLLHMLNLFDFSLIRPELVQRTMAELDKFQEEIAQS